MLEESLNKLYGNQKVSNQRSELITDYWPNDIWTDEAWECDSAAVTSISWWPTHTDGQSKNGSDVQQDDWHREIWAGSVPDTSSSTDTEPNTTPAWTTAVYCSWHHSRVTAGTAFLNPPATTHEHHKDHQDVKQEADWTLFFPHFLTNEFSWPFLYFWWLVKWWCF